jgi:hypothetical protein
MGESCQAQFSDCVFSKCTLLTLAGAQVAVKNAQFSDMAKSAALVSVYAHGTGSFLRLAKCSISGGIQGVSVQAGARLEASDLTVTAVEVTGVEVSDPGSRLTIARGKMHEFSSRYDARHTFTLMNRSHVRMPERQGVHVHSGGRIELFSVAVAGMLKGVCVHRGGLAMLADCTVTQTQQECVLVEGHNSSVCLKRCSLSESKTSRGASVCGAGSTMRATACRFVRNHKHGAAASQGGRLIANGCTSLGNAKVGFSSEDSGSDVELHACSSIGDAYGVCVTNGGRLRANMTHISQSQHGGFDVDSAEAFLTQCSATKCCGPGMFVSGIGGRAELHVEASTIEQNSGCGILAGRNALAIVQGCRSRGNQEEGYKARWNGASMTVVESSSEGDKEGCVVSDGGGLCMKHVEVDGVLKSGTLG